MGIGLLRRHSTTLVSGGDPLCFGRLAFVDPRPWDSEFTPRSLFVAPSPARKPASFSENDAGFRREASSFRQVTSSFQQFPASFRKNASSFRRFAADFRESASSSYRSPGSSRGNTSSFRRFPASSQEDPSRSGRAPTHYARTLPAFQHLLTLRAESLPRFPLPTQQTTHNDGPAGAGSP